MAYIYESTQNGIVNFTMPGTGKSVTLFKGSKVTVDQPLSGGYLRVLRLVGETKDAEASTKQKTKVEDKITKVEEVVAPGVETAEVTVEDAVSAVKEEEVVVEEPVVAETVTEQPKKFGKKKH